MLFSFQRLTGPCRSLASAAIGLALSMGITHPAQAQQYGPRIFWLAPSGINAIEFQLIHQETNTAVDAAVVYPNLEIDTTALVGTYSRTFNLGDTSGQFVFSLPYAWADVDLSAGSRDIDRNAEGFADSYAHLKIGLVNAPGLDIPEYVQYMVEENPQVQVYALAAMFIPTGEYDADHVVNLGSNRWTFRAGVPIVMRLSENWQPGNRTTLEVVPVVDFFTDNQSPPLSSNERVGQFVASRTSQNPLFRLEAHLTQDLGEQVWVSLDTYYVAGGATYADGEGGDNPQSWLAVGGTLGANLWEGGTLSVNGGAVVARNDNSPEGWQMRLVLIQAF
ncbi:transporter [Nodosilinea sp. E11]|uniref:transporter n=1 Tax=Nodosilinea sp. E11 TaxID=3037479 RepID=UPI0029347954|nr:transporter [Nodosilinea sp. E11]WOD37023.1 transporter [Nodosilinea sp. E11]